LARCWPTSPQVRDWPPPDDILASLGLVAAAQGLLAYHGVSALAIVVCAMVAVRLYLRFARSRIDEEPA
jgi:hypothetical protein